MPKTTAGMGTVSRHTHPDLDDDDVDVTQIQSLHDAVRHACASAATGARVVKLSDNTIKVYDCNCWESEYTTLLRLLRPRARVSFASSSSSLSGYQVNVYEPPNNTSRPRIVAVLGTVMACILFAVWLILSNTSKLAKPEL